MGRPHARQRRQGRLHRHHGVEDAGSVQGSLRLHPERRAGSGGHAARAGHRARGYRRQRADRRSRFAAVPALGSRDRGSLADGPQGVHASGRRRLSAAGQPRLPGVLHLLPAPHPRRLSHALHREHRRRDGTAVQPGVAALRHLPRSPLHRTARARRRIVRRDQAARIESHVRGGDEARPARRRPAGQALQRRVPCDELRRRIARSGDAQEVRPASHSAEPPARDHRALPETGHRDGGLLRARIPPGRLELRRGDDRLRHRSGIDVRAVQDADAVSRHADVQADRAAAQRNRLGAVRRFHAGVQASEPDQRAS